MTSRAPLALAVGLSLLGCDRPARAVEPPHPAAPGKAAARAPTPAAGAAVDLASIDVELAKLGSLNGSEAGRLLEKKAAALEASGDLEGAAKAYDDAAGAYNRSPEATTMPQINSDRAKARAAQLRARLGKAPGGDMKVPAPQVNPG